MITSAHQYVSSHSSSSPSPNPSRSLSRGAADFLPHPSSFPSSVLACRSPSAPYCLSPGSLSGGVAFLPSQVSPHRSRTVAGFISKVSYISAASSRCLHKLPFLNNGMAELSRTLIASRLQHVTVICPQQGTGDRTEGKISEDSSKDLSSPCRCLERASPFGMPITFVTQRRHTGPEACMCHSRGIPSREAMLLTSNDDDDGRIKGTGNLHSELSSKVLTLPTILTLGRVAAIPILVFAFYSNEWWATGAVASIFILAAITDWLDGFLARKMGSFSTFGAFLDPVADKLMVATTLVLLCTKPLEAPWAASSPWLIPLPSTAIIGREITMSAVREWAASQGEVLQAAVAVNKLGKWKTASQMVALTVLLITRASRQDGMVFLLVALGVCLLYVSAGLALWSLAVYMKGIWSALVK